MKCSLCGGNAFWVENKQVYGRNYGKSYMIWLCERCGAYVGCHNNTKKPLGTFANKELRDLRIKAHDSIDHLWKSGKKKRKEVYEIISKEFGRRIHIGNSDKKTCEEIIKRFNNHLI